MPAYYDWRTNSYKMAPVYKSASMIQSMFGGGGAQNAAPADVDMSANASSTPVQLMAKFVNNRGWGTPMPAQGMYDWRGNTIGTPAQAQGGGDNMLNGQWAALAGLLGKR
jgi:hypothetical protein